MGILFEEPQKAVLGWVKFLQGLLVIRHGIQVELVGCFEEDITVEVKRNRVVLVLTELCLTILAAAVIQV